MRSLVSRVVAGCGASKARPLTEHVIHTPFFYGNPYHAQLKAEQEAKGATVRLQTTTPFLLPMLRAGCQNVIHLHWTHPYTRGSCWRYWAKLVVLAMHLGVARLRGAAIVWTVHNLHNHEGHNLGRERCVAWLFSRLAQRVIVHCDGAAAEVASRFRIPGRRIAVIPHGSYVDAYHDRLPRSEARRRLGLEANSVVVLLFGAVRGYKGADRLIEALAAVPDSNLRVVIAGRVHEPALAQELAQVAERDRRLFLRLEFVPDDEVPVYMAAADVVALPYRDALTSGALLLAMSYGKAVLAPRVGCIPETVAPDGAIWLQSDNAQAVANGLRRILQARDSLPAWGRSNLERARTLTWASIAEATLQVYRSASGCGDASNL